MDNVESETRQDADRINRDRINRATEVAYSALVNTAGKFGIKINPCMGLVYLPSQEVTRQFQEACKAVLDSLKVSP